jgi:hypothetical protein
MERLAMVAVALGGLLFGACAGPEETDQEFCEEPLSLEPALRGPCEDRCEADYDRYMKFCNTMTGRARRSCQDEAFRIMVACMARCP